MKNFYVMLGGAALAAGRDPAMAQDDTDGAGDNPVQGACQPGVLPAGKINTRSMSIWSALPANTQTKASDNSWFRPSRWNIILTAINVSIETNCRDHPARCRWRLRACRSAPNWWSDACWLPATVTAKVPFRSGRGENPMSAAGWPIFTLAVPTSRAQSNGSRWG